MALPLLQKQPQKLSLYASFLIPLILITSGTASVSHSVIKISRANGAIESLFVTGSLDSPKENLLQNMNDRTERLFFRNRTDSEILAAALLLQWDNKKELAENFLHHLAEKDSALSHWSNELLLNTWVERQDWVQIAEYTASRIQTGSKDPALRKHLYESIWKGNLPIPEFAGPLNGKNTWEIPLMDKEGKLTRQEYLHFLLSEDLIQIKEMLQSWNPSYAEEEISRNILEARGLVEQGQYDDAETLVKDLWGSDLDQFPRLPALFLSELRDVILRSGSEKRWVPFMEEWSGRDSHGYSGAFLAASVYEGAGKNAQAVESYENAAKQALSRDERNRAEWYQFRLLIRNEPEGVTEFLASHASGWGKTDYFDDLLDEYYSLLVRSKGWSKLKETVSILIDTPLEDPVLQGIFLLQKAVKDKRLPPPAFLDEAKTKEIRQNASLSYFSLLLDPENWPGEEGADKAIEPETLSPEETAIDRVYQILLKAGKLDDSWYLWNSREDSLSGATVESFCKQFYNRGDFYQCIILSGYWFYRWPVSSAVKLIPWLYPIDPELPIAEYGKEYGQQEELILGIIRRESAFHRTIESHAGAVGLMQIMPTTASDLASRYRIENWDLTNPLDNVRMGSIYLNWLKERPWTKNQADVIAAYNGGGGNLRQWKKQFGDLEEQLFIQSIPFYETRNYIRKVIVAAGSYKYLNTGAPPGEWIDQMFLPFPAM